MRDLEMSGDSIAARDGCAEPANASRSQIRGSALLMAGQVFAVLINLVSQVLLVRYLSKTGYGSFAFALSIVQISELVASFGLRRGVNRFLPLYEERGEQAKAAGVLVFAIGTVLGLALAIVLLVIGFRGLIAGSVAGDSDAATVLAILILLTPIHALESLLDGALAVFARPRAIALRKHVFIPTMRLAVIVLLTLSNADVTLLAWGWVLVGVIGLVAYGVLLVHVMGARGLLGPIRSFELIFPIRELLGFTVPLLTSDIAGALFSGAATVLLGLMAGAAEVATFRAVLPISLTMTYVVSNFALLFVPLATRLYERSQSAEVNRLYWQTTAWIAVLSLPIFLPAFAFAGPVSELLFGERYADSGPVLAILVIGHFVYAATGMNGLLLGVYGDVRFLAWTNAATVLCIVALNLVLIPPFGALGSAVASTATLIMGNTAFQVGLARRTDVRGLDPDYVGLFALIAVVVAALTALNAFLHPPLGLGAVAVALASLGVMLYARRHLAFAEAFPELARVRLLRRLLVAGDETSRPSPRDQ
jgi:O-antigen/teichoic acid export membrane protein